MYPCHAGHGRTLTHKGYGRIYVAKLEDIEKVHAIMREIDEYEFSGYMPKHLVAPFSEYPKVIYTGKFGDMDMDLLTALCWSQGVFIWVFDSGREDCPSDVRKFDTEGNARAPHGAEKE